ncbi:hypothetical protein [Corynebacterium sp. 13CS0277]|uniref:hypothetical protein n=1 Tax=Corynebacterium sp. 13CS0277 TaxID=2071994 RepID=UPI001E5F263F|nr:hypothetical protein [Corynebacterium sp. 13CS0277]
MKPAHIVLLIVVFLGCLALSWWQWTRFQSGNGSFQNLGYALQWPVYGVIAIFMYRRTMAYEDELADGDAEPVKSESAGTIDAIDDNFLPQRTQLTVEEFNAMNQQTRRRRRAHDEDHLAAETDA